MLVSSVHSSVKPSIAFNRAKAEIDPATANNNATNNSRFNSLFCSSNSFNKVIIPVNLFWKAVVCAEIKPPKSLAGGRPIACGIGNPSIDILPDLSAAILKVQEIKYV